MQVHLTRVFRKPETSKRTGKPYTKLSFKCQEYGDRWIGGFGGQWNSAWKEGDVVEATVVDTGQYLNFEQTKAPGARGIDPQQLQGIEKKLDEILSILKGSLTTANAAQPQGAYDEPPQTDSVDVDDIPF